MANNIQNLKPRTHLSKEEAVEMGRKGGIASGEARREKKLFKETIEKKLGKSIDSIIDALIDKASNGDVNASTFLRDTYGEKPVDKAEVDLGNKIKVDVVDE